MGAIHADFGNPRPVDSGGHPPRASAAGFAVSLSRGAFHSRRAGEARAVFFNQAILSQLSTFPLGSSSGGFSYAYDPSLGTFTRATSSFGPAFAERALTVGRHRLSVGTNFRYLHYDSFEGKDLQNGDIKFYLTHQPVGGFFFEGDVIQTALHLNLSTNTVAFFANYGVTSRLDVAVAVPIVSVDMNASIDATVLRLATGDTGPSSAIHVFSNGTESQTFSDAAKATGIGDVILRAKYRFLDVAGGGLAAALDLRLPSGDQANLLGTGATQGKVAIIASGTHGIFEPHVNIGKHLHRQIDLSVLQPRERVRLHGRGRLRGGPEGDDHSRSARQVAARSRHAAGTTSHVQLHERRRRAGVGNVSRIRASAGKPEPAGRRGGSEVQRRRQPVDFGQRSRSAHGGRHSRQDHAGDRLRLHVLIDRARAIGNYFRPTITHESPALRS